MNLITVHNNYSQLLTDSEKLKDTLWRLLRFRDKGYFHSALYKQKKWDGFRDFFSKKTGKFLTGLIPEVKLALRKLKVEYQVRDDREAFSFWYREIDEHFMNYGDNPIVLYDYQVELVNQIIQNHRGIVTAPPGSGKTNVMIASIKTLPPNTPTLILANRTSLVDQNYEELQKWGFGNVGRVYGRKNDPNYITCVTSQSAHKIPDLDKIKVLFVDEIHEMMSAGPIKIYKQLKNCSVRIAMSGTPFKFDGKDPVQKYQVKGWIGPPFKTKITEEGVLSTKFLQERKTLSVSNCTFWPLHEPDLKYAIYQDAVTYGLAENHTFHKIVANLVEERCPGRTLILVERLAHGDHLKKLIPGSFWIKGEDDLETRRFVIDHLKNYKGNLVAIATQGILNTGINVMVHNLINCAGGKAAHQIVQRIGRGLRQADDKVALEYHDFMFHMNPYLEKHSEERVKILDKSGHKIKIMDELP